MLVAPKDLIDVEKEVSHVVQSQIYTLKKGKAECTCTPIQEVRKEKELKVCNSKNNKRCISGII